MIEDVVLSIATVVLRKIEIVFKYVYVQSLMLFGNRQIIGIIFLLVVTYCILRCDILSLA
jgi:hypothetical protein